MSKLPSFQFYPADWRKDPAVQSLSYFDRGIWFEILCLMHESEQRGKLLLNGKPMPDEALSRLLGLDKQILTKALTTLLDYGVASRDEQGALFNRRMIRDEKLRQIRTESGKKGGNPVLLNQNSTNTITKTKNEDNQIPTPSSSSSSSLNTHTHAGAHTNKLKFPLKQLYEAFPDIELQPAQVGLIESEVREADKTAWAATIEIYKGNFNPAKNSYLPEKVGNLLNVFKKEKENLEKKQTAFLNGSGQPRSGFLSDAIKR